MAIIEDFVASKKINYTCMALSFYVRVKKAPHGSFYEDEWFLNFGDSAYFTLFEFDFVNITLDNYS